MVAPPLDLATFQVPQVRRANAREPRQDREGSSAKRMHASLRVTWGISYFNMTHTALARRYRPTRFSDLVAQGHVAAGLAGAVAKERVAHAYLLTGPRGVGKTSAARILAMALNCEDKESATKPGEPCGECDSCRRVWSGSASIDVVEIDAASNRGVDDARELRERAMYAASGPNRHKVYIVDEAHMLTREAWNALLKVLEEPPPGVVFVFATTEPQKIAATAAPVMSRVQRFDFRRIGPRSIVERLKWVAVTDGIEVEDEALELIAHVADGGMRDGLSLLDQALAYGEGAVTAARVREALGLIDHETYAELLTLIAERRTAEVFPFVARLVEAGADLTEFVHGTGEVFRALLIQLLGGKPEALTDSLRTSVEQCSSQYRAGDVLRMLKLLAAAENAIRRSPNARLHVETLLLQWSLLDRTVELTDVLDAMSGSSPMPPVQAPAVQRPVKVEKQQRRATKPVESQPAAHSEGAGELSLDSLAAGWSQVIESVGRQRRMAREALGHATPTSVNQGVIELEVSECEVHLEGLERNRAVITKCIEDVTGGAVTNLVYKARPADSTERPAPPPTRLDRNADQKEQLKRHRESDPGLDAFAEALDLEVLE